ncbi:MAG: hypothetical protein PHE83_05780 [Opitutaceae bacterium]|nr:hypothetical protein [Opitutaceae bacterium]
MSSKIAVGQAKNRSAVDFSQRTDAIALALEMPLRALPMKIGVSDRMFWGYRSGKYPVKKKGWEKLRNCEIAVGLAAPDPEIKAIPNTAAQPATANAAIAMRDVIQKTLGDLLKRSGDDLHQLSLILARLTQPTQSSLSTMSEEDRRWAERKYAELKARAAAEAGAAQLSKERRQAS